MMVKKRLVLLTILTAVSAAMYLPFAAASGAGIDSTSSKIIFLAANVLVGLVFGLLGLRLADRAELPMPFLRPWELGERRTQAWRRPLLVTILWTIPPALLVAFLVPRLGFPENSGTLAERLMTTPFAAINLQIVLLLVGTSLLFLILKNRVWAALASGALLAIFHTLGASGFDTIFYWQMSFNAGMGAIFGWIYLRYGFEYAVVGHAAAHAIMMIRG